MARPPQVTRHIIYTECVCRCADTKTGTIFGKIIRLKRIVSVPKKQLQLCRQKAEKEGIRVLQIEKARYYKAFVLQDELTFLEQGKILARSELKADEINKQEEN